MVLVGALAALWVSASVYNASIVIPHYRCWDEQLGGKQADDDVLIAIDVVGGPLATPAVWSIWGDCDGTH